MRISGEGLTSILSQDENPGRGHPSGSIPRPRSRPGAIQGSTGPGFFWSAGRNSVFANNAIFPAAGKRRSESRNLIGFSPVRLRFLKQSP
jgi:hypothetical protein